MSTEKVRSIITIEISAFSYQQELNNLKSVKRYKGAITKEKFSTNLSCNGLKLRDKLRVKLTNHKARTD